MGKYKKIPVQVKAAFWFLVCSFLQRGISVITTPIFTRLLTTEDYGQLSVFNSWSSILTTLVSLQLSSGAYTQGLVKYDHDQSRYSSSMQGLMMVLVSGWTVVYILFHEFWNRVLSLTTVQMLAMLATIWASAVFAFWSSEQRVRYKYRRLVALTLTVSLVQPVVGIIFVFLADDKVTARIFGIALVDCAAYAGLFAVQMLRGKAFCVRTYWKHALLFNLPLIPHYLSQTVLASSDRIMIDQMIGSSEAGIYGLGYQISCVMSMLNTSLMQVLSPWMYQKIKYRKEKDIASVAYLTLLIIAFANLALILFAPELVAIFAPEAYRDAKWIIPPVAMSVFFTFSYDLYAKFAFYYEKTNLIMVASVIGAILNVALNYIFIGFFGYVAAGYTTLICYIVYCIGHYILMTKICDEFCDGIRPYNLWILILISSGFVTAGFILLVTYHFWYIRYALCVLAIVAVAVKRREIVEVVNKLTALRNAGGE